MNDALETTAIQLGVQPKDMAISYLMGHGEIAMEKDGELVFKKPPSVNMHVTDMQRPKSVVCKEREEESASSHDASIASPVLPPRFSSMVHKSPFKEPCHKSASTLIERERYVPHLDTKTRLAEVHEEETQEYASLKALSFMKLRFVRVNFQSPPSCDMWECT